MGHTNFWSQKKSFGYRIFERQIWFERQASRNCAWSFALCCL